MLILQPGGGWTAAAGSRTGDASAHPSTGRFKGRVKKRKQSKCRQYHSTQNHNSLRKLKFKFSHFYDVPLSIFILSTFY